MRRQLADAPYVDNKREIKSSQIKKAIDESQKLSTDELNYLQHSSNKTTPPKFFEHLKLIDDLVWKTIEMNEIVRNKIIARETVKKLFLKYLKMNGFKFNTRERFKINNILEVVLQIHERTSGIGPGYFVSEPSRLYSFFYIDDKVKQEVRKKARYQRIFKKI